MNIRGRRGGIRNGYCRLIRWRLYKMYSVVWISWLKVMLRLKDYKVCLIQGIFRRYLR